MQRFQNVKKHWYLKMSNKKEEMYLPHPGAIKTKTINSFYNTIFELQNDNLFPLFHTDRSSANYEFYLALL